MKNNFYLIWIDDVSTRENTMENFKEFFNLKYSPKNLIVKFVNVNGKILIDKISPLFSDNEPDIVIIDHFLNKTKNYKTNIASGNTLAQLIKEKEKWPKCPIVGITAADKYDYSKVKNEFFYEDIFSDNEIFRFFPFIHNIIVDFCFLKDKTINNIDEILNIINVPSEERDKLISILPTSIKNNFTDLHFNNNLFKWIRFSLHSLNGFLYNALWAATLLGLNIEGFNKYEKTFNGALYSGIFTDPYNRRWWRNTLKKIIFNKYPSESSNYPWVIGRKLTKNNSYYSKCQYCKKDYPEIAGFTDETKKYPAQLHLKCSIPLIKEEKKLFFEETRIMKR
jgi:hypothetical protein